MFTDIRRQLLAVHNSSKRKPELQDALGEAERSFVKSVTMAVMWCARAFRFEASDTAAKLSHLFEKINSARSY